jgi:hypothetical protein
LSGDFFIVVDGLDVLDVLLVLVLFLLVEELVLDDGAGGDD